MTDLYLFERCHGIYKFFPIPGLSFIIATFYIYLSSKLCAKRRPWIYQITKHLNWEVHRGDKEFENLVILVKNMKFNDVDKLELQNRALLN